jgi:biotin operon repressor
MPHRETRQWTGRHDVLADIGDMRMLIRGKGQNGDNGDFERAHKRLIRSRPYTRQTRHPGTRHELDKAGIVQGGIPRTSKSEASTMSTVGQREKRTQQRVVTLFRESSRGIEKINRECLEHGVEPPAYDFGMARLMLMFRTNPAHVHAAALGTTQETTQNRLGEKLGEKLGETRAAIVRAMAANPHVTVVQLARILKISTRAVEKNLRLLKSLGHIERMGTGTGDMIRQCREAGLPEPEFSMSDGFVITIRRTVQQRIGEASGRPESRPESLERRVLGLLADGSLSKSELSSRLGQKEVSGHLNQVIRVLLADQTVEYTRPEKPTSRLQKYRLTDKGAALLAGVRRKDEPI